MINQVFISYRHETSEHARAVRRLGELLRQAHLPVMLDQFYLDENPGGPNDGWPRWCEDCANLSACVIIIASTGWFSAYEGISEPHFGYGVATEAHLFRQHLYDNKNNNARIRIAFLHELSVNDVPIRLRAWHQFHPFSEKSQLDQLIRWVKDRLGLSNIESPTINCPEPDIEDCKQACPTQIMLESPADKVQKTKRYAIGEKGPGGGIVFFVEETGLHGLEARSHDSWEHYKDYNRGQSLFDRMINNKPYGQIWKDALTTARSYGEGWYLPTKDELDLLYKRRNIVGGFCVKESTYWSSTEHCETIGNCTRYGVWGQDFENGSQSGWDEESIFSVRAIRAF